MPPTPRAIIYMYEPHRHSLDAREVAEDAACANDSAASPDEIKPRPSRALYSALTLDASPSACTVAVEGAVADAQDGQPIERRP